MPFKIAARTILHLGADLISSDAVALYELIKNSIDAGSSNGVDIRVQIVFPHTKLDEFLSRLSSELSVKQARKEIIEHISIDAPQDMRDEFVHRVGEAKSSKALSVAVRAACDDLNRITISDTGTGMSLGDLERIYLTIGTTNRASVTRKQLAAGESTDVSYLGEKGIGRLSVMRLGNIVEIETATTEDTHLNNLKIDWRDFEKADELSYDTVKITPTQGAAKPVGFTKGTIITIKALKSRWDAQVLSTIAQTQVARLVDPFSVPKGARRRFPIRFWFNGSPVEYGRTILRALLDGAHATCKVEYRVKDGEPLLTYDIKVKNLDEVDTDGNPVEQRVHDTRDMTDLVSLEQFVQGIIPRSALATLGNFTCELYWYNRQKIKALPDIGDRSEVRKRHQQWCGILLYRDGYRVLPYGDEGDDWLGLDRRALAAGGYKLNTKQFIGRVKIGRIGNPELIDQTNRQGLRDCDEKAALTALISDVIIPELKRELDNVQVATKKARTAFSTSELDERMENITNRMNTVIKQIKSMKFDNGEIVLEINDIRIAMADIYSRAMEKSELVESERDRMIHLAGIGLAVESIAHELSRATIDTQRTLQGIPSDKFDSQTQGLFYSLGMQMEIIQKRLDLLDRLSLPRRNRRSKVDLYKICRSVIDSHHAKFVRHKIECMIYCQGSLTPSSMYAFAIEALVIQILENLISNSVYWMTIQQESQPSYQPQIKIEIEDTPPSIRFWDNGPGIPVARREVVFEPYFSTKGSTTRHGLGLWIAQQNAEMMGGELTLVDEPAFRRGRLNSFILTLVKEPNA